MNGLGDEKYSQNVSDSFEYLQRQSQPPVISSFRYFNKTTDCWPSYTKELERHFIANGIRDDNVKRMCLLRWIGSDTLADLQKLFNGLVYEKCFDEIVAAPYQPYARNQSILEARLKFYQTKMKEHQTYPEWVIELRAAAAPCLFQCQKVDCTESYVDNKIRDMIVLHTPHDRVRAAALKRPNPTLDDVLQLASICMCREANVNGDGDGESLSIDATALREESTTHFGRLEIQSSKTRLQMKTAIVFIVGYAANRDGLYDDIRNIFQTFKIIFNADIQNWTNINKDKLRQKFKELTKDEWRQRFIKVDFVTVFCLAHGQEEGEALFGNRMHDIKALLLTPLFRIKELDKKLKWLVLQTCRGKFNDPPGIERDVVINYYPDYYVISYCTGEGTISWQPNEPGKIFIKSICKELRENAENLSLNQIMTNVNSLVKQYGERQTFKAIPAPETRSNYPSEFYFHKRAKHYVKISM